MSRFAAAVLVSSAVAAWAQSGGAAKPDAAVAVEYAAKAPACKSANSQERWDDAVKLCSDLDTVALAFHDEAAHAAEIVVAHDQYGQALAFDGDLPAGTKMFRAAVAVATKDLKPNQMEYATAYYWLAFAEHGAGDHTPADADYHTAEVSFRAAMEAVPEKRALYGTYLAHTLSFHATLLAQMGRGDEAARLRTEAKALDPGVKLGVEGEK
jgi:tetratricopeptide (TPR) repeat protein